MRIAIVWVITLIGLALGSIGIYRLPGIDAMPWLFASVAIDAIDGAIARRLGATTNAGAKLDWTIDTMISYAIVYRMAPAQPFVSVSLACMLIVIQTYASATAQRFSGRTLVTLTCAIAAWWP